MWKLAASLFGVFLPLSFFTIGGGQAIIADIQRQVVVSHHWLTQREFYDIYAFSRMTPGPGSLYMTLIGWRVAGIPGALAATIAIFLPTIILTYLVASFWSKFEHSRWLKSFETGLKPVAAGLVLSGVYVLLSRLYGAPWAQMIALGGTAILYATRTSPLLVLAAGSGLFVVAHQFALV